MCLCSVSVHAIQMGEKVTSVFEKAISILARRDDVSGDRYIFAFLNLIIFVLLYYH